MTPAERRLVETLARIAYRRLRRRERQRGSERGKLPPERDEP